MPLIHDPLDQTVLRLQVQDVKLVDPGRKDHQRRLEYLVCRRRILDQFQHPVAVYHRPGRGGDVPADMKGFRISKRHQQVAIAGLDVAHQVFQPLHKAFPVRLDRAAQGIGVGAQKIGRCEHVDDLLRKVLDPFAICGVQMIQTAHGIRHGFRIQQVLLLEIIEKGVRFPQGVRKPPVLRRRIRRGLELALCQHLLGLDIVLQALAPVADLMLQNFCRILHHFGHIGRRRLHIDVLAWPAQRRIGLFAP